MYNGQYDALYGRQSIEKKDSISVESQLEYCRYETHGAPCLEYADRGFSGKNTNRPDFERMIADIRAGKIRRVIVYKLDRISRSILDFANMMELFQTYNVEFVSSTEKFDTSTPIGRAMLNICIVFAQLERETIQKRVTDAYYARNKRGFYMGGRVPYGFRLKETVIDNVRTSMYEEVPEESRQLKLIYSMYADTSYSLGDIIRYLKEHHIENLRGSEWTTARLSEMLQNPVYVEADIEVYKFFASQGASIHNPASDFTGNNACYRYKGADTAERNQCGYTGKEIVLAPHKGVIPSKIWLDCRRRCLNNRQLTKTCKAKNSWLTGKVKCRSCGYAMVIRKAKTKMGRYFVCSHAGTGGTCKGAGCTVYADVLEEYIAEAIRERLCGFEFLSEEKRKGDTTRISEIKVRIVQLDDEINALLSKVGDADTVLMKYMNDKVSVLDDERRRLGEELGVLSYHCRENAADRISDPAEKWEQLSFEDKQAVADIFIKVIKIAGGEMEVIWRI